MDSVRAISRLVSPAAARRATRAVSARAAFHPDLGDVLGEPSPHGSVAGPFEPHHHVVGELLAIGLAPAVREQVLQACSGRLP